MTKLKPFIIGLIILTSNIQYAGAACTSPVTYLKVGELAPCNGYIYTEEYDLKIRKTLVEYTTLKELSPLYETQADILSKRIKNLQEQNDILENKLQTTQKLTYLSYIGFFLLGAGTVYLASEVVSNVK